MKDIFRRLLDKVGKGGIKCYCCNPYSCRRDKRDKLTRRVRSRLKRIDVLDGLGEFEDTDSDINPLNTRK